MLSKQKVLLAIKKVLRNDKRVLGEDNGNSPTGLRCKESSVKPDAESACYPACCGAPASPTSLQDPEGHRQRSRSSLLPHGGGKRDQRIKK